MKMAAYAAYIEAALQGQAQGQELPFVIIRRQSGQVVTVREPELRHACCERKDDLTTLGDLLQSGKVTPVIDRTYPLSEVPQAIRHLEGAHARGKVVITLESVDQT
jgi:NADPH:quinone reductase-like Zn-dependent oxidoreductase